MGETIHHLQSRVVYFSERVNRLSVSDKQNGEIGQLISSISTSPHGTDTLHEIFAECSSIIESWCQTGLILPFESLVALTESRLHYRSDKFRMSIQMKTGESFLP